LITKEQLDYMFEDIAKNSPWDTSKPLRWGYFFTDESDAKLRSAGQILQREGYRLVDVYQSEKEAPSELDLWWLHVEKVEMHTPDTLHARNLSLYAFAEANDLRSYDGMDVGPVSDE
jgi:Regulator of ribonuclease activity B